MKNVRKILWGLLTVICAIMQCARIAFPIAATGATLFSVSFQWLAYDRNGSPRVYIALPVGTKLQNHPFSGKATFTHITTGDMIVEVIRTIQPGESILNMSDMQWRDWSARHKVCLRLGISPVDIGVFAENRNCLWLHDTTGDDFVLITGPANIRAAWEDVESKRPPANMQLAPGYVTAITPLDLAERQELETQYGALVYEGALMIENGAQVEIGGISPETAPLESPYMMGVPDLSGMIPGLLWLLGTALLLWSNFWGKETSSGGVVLQPGAGD